MSAVVLRICERRDEAALRRLAERDCATVPGGTVLGAEVRGELRAAICLETGAVIADPFHPTAGLVDLLRTRAAQLEAAGPRVRGLTSDRQRRVAGSYSEGGRLDLALPAPRS